MGRVDRWVVMTGALFGLVGCSGGSGAPELPEGASAAREAVDVFLKSSQTALLSRQSGNLAEADRAYKRMAAVFGTDEGSINRSRSSSDVRSRMIVLAACLRPTSFEIISALDPDAHRLGATTVSVEIVRGEETITLPFSVIRGPQDRWFIEQIQIEASSFAC